MISLFKFRRLFNRQLACFFSAFIILLTFFFTVPASAGSLHDEFTFYQACPVVFNVCISSTNTDNWLDPYSYDVNICPVASIPLDSSTVSGTNQDFYQDSNAGITGTATYEIICTSQSLDLANNQFVGTADYKVRFSQMKVYSGSNMSSDYTYQFKYKFNNFWVWSFNYSDANSYLTDSSSNISINFNAATILSSRLYYDVLVFDSEGSPIILNNHDLYITPEDLSSDESIGSLTPEFFINHDSTLSSYLDSPDDYFFIYVNTWETTSTYNPGYSPTFNLSYCFNPYLHDLSTLYDYFAGGGSSSPDDPSGNPAFGFIPYTDWLGSAASGFFDLQIFPGFTLGGVFISVFAFACVMWFLKLVAGG